MLSDTTSDGKDTPVADYICADLLNTFLDVKSMKILCVITDLPKSVSQISRETKIPINTVYNKMRKLAGQKIIKISGNINELGRRQLQYQSKLSPTAYFLSS